jgi:hypothetical protein
MPIEKSRWEEFAEADPEQYQPTWDHWNGMRTREQVSRSRRRRKVFWVAVGVILTVVGLTGTIVNLLQSSH